MKTKERLAQALHAIGEFELVRRARAGEFDDYECSSVTPKVDLVRALYLLGRDEATALALRVKDGQFDNTKEEADAWAASPEGRKVFGKLGL